MSAVPVTEDRFRLSLHTSAGEPHHMARLPFVLIVAALLGGGMIGVLFLSTMIQSKSSELGKLQEQEADLRYEGAVLTAQVQDLRSSSRLADRAWELGMRPNPNPAFIRMPDGRVLGVASVVTGQELPGLRPVSALPPVPVIEPFPEPSPSDETGAQELDGTEPAASNEADPDASNEADPATPNDTDLTEPQTNMDEPQANTDEAQANDGGEPGDQSTPPVETEPGQ